MKVLNFDIVSFLVSSLSTPFLIQGHGKLLPCVLNVIVSSLTFKSMIHLELIFVFSRRMVPDFIFFHVLMQLYEHHLLERLFFFSHIFIYLLAGLGLPCGSRASRVVAHEHGCPAACGILVPQPGLKRISPALGGRFFTTGPPGKSLLRLLFAC